MFFQAANIFIAQSSFAVSISPDLEDTKKDLSV
jgi:hypothetical protein